MDVPFVSREQMARVDRLLVEELGIHLLQLMENAGRSLAELGASRFLGGELGGRRVVVLAGPGGNGGGALAAARHLANRGASVSIVLARSVAGASPAAAQQYRIARAMKLPLLPHDRVGVLPEVDLVVDGLLGSSIEGAPRSVESVLLDWANSRSAPRLALDLPSGLHPDSGEPGRPTLRADATLTLGLPKLGLREERAHDFVGELYLADISVPPELWRRIGVTVSPALFERAPVLRLEGAG